MVWAKAGPGFDPESVADEAVGIFGLPWSEAESAVVLVPVPWAATASWGLATCDGPGAIMRVSPQLDLVDPEFGAVGLARPFEYGIHMRAERTNVRQWNEAALVDRVPAAVDPLSAKLCAQVEGDVEGILAAGKIPGVVGGDHSVPLGAIAAATRLRPGLGILHIDAHADLRVRYEGFEHSHASIMHNVLALHDVAVLVQVGVRDLSPAEHERIRTDARIRTHLDVELAQRSDRGESWEALCEEIVAGLPQCVYVSFDIDGLDPALCPGTGTPVPGGLSFRQAMTLLAVLGRSGKRVLGFDLVEVGASDWDGNVGARVLYRLCTVALYAGGARDS